MSQPALADRGDKIAGQTRARALRGGTLSGGEKGAVRTTCNTNTIIYGVSRHQRKVLPTTPSCSIVPPLATIPLAVARQPFRRRPKPSSALSTHSIRNYVETARVDALETNRVSVANANQEISGFPLTMLDLRRRI